VPFTHSLPTALVAKFRNAIRLNSRHTLTSVLPCNNRRCVEGNIDSDSLGGGEMARRIFGPKKDDLIVD
jgi:hypothetical protein